MRAIQDLIADAGLVGNERADELSSLGIAAVIKSYAAPIEEPVDYLTAQYRQIVGG